MSNLFLKRYVDTWSYFNVFPSPRPGHLMGIGAFVLLVFWNRIQWNDYKSVCLLHLVTGAWCRKYRNTWQDVKLPLKRVFKWEASWMFGCGRQVYLCSQSPVSTQKSSLKKKIVSADKMTKAAGELRRLQEHKLPLLALSGYTGGNFFWNGMEWNEARYCGRVKERTETIVLL